MYVKQLSENLGVNPDTIRYYTRIGLLNPAKNDSGFHDYNAEDRRTLRFILRAKQLGFTLETITEILKLSESGESPCPRVRELMQENIEATEKTYREVSALRNRMRKAVKSWQKMEDKHPSGNMICTLIEEWEDEIDP